ncbi:RDD family protein [Pontibacter toksunensis]|uniref:RDD family protein n=1 Tax=Pontibacter toksunensis TaxID=1332631 RepID=A0ABW6BT23_9BACT
MLEFILSLKKVLSFQVFIFFLLYLGLAISFYTLLGALLSVFSTKTPKEIGLLVSLDEEYELKLFLVNLCNLLNTRLPNSIVLHAEPTLYVVQGKIKLMNGKLAKGRILVIGVPLLHYLTVDQLRAILAHELAHFTGFDTLYSSFVTPAYFSLSTGKKIYAQMIAKNINELVSLVMMPQFYFICWYLELFKKIHAKISRLREIRADYIASSICGRNVFTTGLTNVIGSLPVFNKIIHSYIGLSLNKTNNIYQNLKINFNNYKDIANEAINDELKKSTLVGDLYPSLSERLKSISLISDKEATDRSARDLITYIDSYEEELSKRYLKILDLKNKITLYSDSVKIEQQNKLYKKEKYVGLWLRSVAFFIDFVIIGVVASLIIIISVILAYPDTFSGINSLVIFIIIWTSYFTIYEASYIHGTIGKKQMGIMVVDYQNQQLKPSQSFLRNLSKLFFIGFILILFDRKRQSFHDKLSKTFVVFNTASAERTE